MENKAVSLMGDATNCTKAGAIIDRNSEEETEN